MDNHPYNVYVDQRGRLVLPAVVRQRVGIQQGGTLILTLQDDGMLRLTRPEEAVRRSRGLLHTLSTDDSTHKRLLAEELIAERRVAAKHE